MPGWRPFASTGSPGHIPTGRAVHPQLPAHLLCRLHPPACLQVNPIAVNSSFADVFTRNKRSVLRLSTHEYGEVAYVAIGATVSVLIEH